MNKKGFTLLEILVSALILALVIGGMANVFLASRRLLLRARLKIQAAELARLFLAPLQMDIKQSDWNSVTSDYNSGNRLQKGTRLETSQNLMGIDYRPTYEVSVPPGFSATSAMRRVKVTINWTEPSS